jgi:tetratricopeptide (TPR) repeat protein
MMRSCRLAALAALLLAAPGGALANPESERLRAKATIELFNLDDTRAIESYRAAAAADPGDAAAHRGLASALLVRIAMLRGTMTIDSYLGRVARRDVSLPPPPPELAREFHGAIERAIAVARRHAEARPRDPQARYELGAAVGIRASYLATVEGGVLAAFRAAREAFDTHEQLLELAPQRADAGLIVGMYRYIVAAMSMPVRWMAYAAGFGGGRERGIGLVERAAAFAGDNQSDAKLALILLYMRERRFDDALRQVDDLRARYPRNRLLVLERGSTLLRAGRHAEADQTLSEGIDGLQRDARSRMFGEDALWFYRRGQARAALGRAADARADLQRALASEGRAWVHGRAHAELGALALRAGDRPAARSHLEAAVRLGDSDSDGASADRARALLSQATRR